MTQRSEVLRAQWACYRRPLRVIRRHAEALPQTMILVGYDGSDDARSALRRAGTLMPGHPAVVLCVYDELAADRAGATTSGGHDAAELRAREGAALGHEMLIDAEPGTARCDGTVAETLLAVAERLRSQAIVVGRHGQPGAWAPAPDERPGSVARDLLRDSPLPVLVVPTGP